MDRGELRFRFLLNPGGDELPRLAQALELPPVCTLVAASTGDLPCSGSLADISPSTLRMLALKRAEEGDALVLRAREMSRQATEATLRWLGHAISLGQVHAHSIATWRLSGGAHGWMAQRCSILEEAEAFRA